MRKLLSTAAIALNLLATPAWADISDEIANVAAGIEVYKESCGELPPKFKTIYDFLNSLHGDPADRYALRMAIRATRHELETAGKETWCQQMRLRAIL